MHWDIENRTNLWYKVLFPTTTEIGTADHEKIGHLFKARESDLDLERLIFSYHAFAPCPFRRTEYWG